MQRGFVLGAALLALAAAGALADDAFKSGPQKGDSPPPFNPLHITGPRTGQRSCLV